MKTPTWQLSTFPRCPHHCRLTPTECEPRVGKLLGSKAMMPFAAVPTRCSSFRLLTLSCGYRMLSGSDCNNNMLRDVTGVKRGDTVGIGRAVSGKWRAEPSPEPD